MSDSVRPHRRQSTRLPCPWDPPGKNTGVGCHFPLQCMKVKSESEVAQSCPTLSDPMDCSLPGSSAHGIFQARALEWGAIAFSKCTKLEGKKTNGCCTWLYQRRQPRATLGRMPASAAEQRWSCGRGGKRSSTSRADRAQRPSGKGSKPRGTTLLSAQQGSL